MDTAEVRRELVAGFQMTVAGLVRMAACVRILESRGEDLSDLRSGLIEHVRRIAYGQTLPGVVARFIGYPLLLSRVTALPMPDQERLGSGESVDVFVRTGEVWDRRRADPLKLTGEQVHQVFGPGGIRDEVAQKLWVESQSNKPPRRLPAQQGKIRVDRTRAGLIVNRTFVPQSEILAALADLAPPQEESEDTERKTLIVGLSAAEHRALKLRAVQQDVDMTDLVRHSLRMAGLLKPSE